MGERFPDSGLRRITATYRAFGHQIHDASHPGLEFAEQFGADRWLIPNLADILETRQTRQYCVRQPPFRDPVSLALQFIRELVNPPGQKPIRLGLG